MRVADDVQSVAAVLQKPRAGYRRRLDETRQMLISQSGEASRQLEIFADRVAGLTAAELRELHEETFRGETAAVQRLLGRLARCGTDAAAAAAAVGALEPFLQRLGTERNPLAYVVRSLCCLLLQRVRSGELEQSSS